MCTLTCHAVNPWSEQTRLRRRIPRSPPGARRPFHRGEALGDRRPQPRPLRSSVSSSRLHVALVDVLRVRAPRGREIGRRARSRASLRSSLPLASDASVFSPRAHPAIPARNWRSSRRVAGGPPCMSCSSPRCAHRPPPRRKPLQAPPNPASSFPTPSKRGGGGGAAARRYVTQVVDPTLAPWSSLSPNRWAA